MTEDLPTMRSSAHTHTAYAGANFAGMAQGNLVHEGHASAGNRPPILGGAVRLIGIPDNVANQHALQKSGDFLMTAPRRRIVKVFIADQNENIPLEICLLHKGEEKLTDLTDQELFFELDIRSMLDAHNKERIKIIDKKVKDRTEHLEPAKVRDLSMVVVTVASF